MSSNKSGVLMSDEETKGLLSPLRRKLLMGMAAVPAITMLPRASFAQAPATSAVNTTGLAVTDTEVTVGILHSATGTMAISETGSIEAEKLGTGLNITVMSLTGKLDVGINSCWELVPDVWDLADDFEVALQELLTAAA